MGGAELRRHCQNPNVVVESVIGQAEAGSNGGIAVVPRGVRDTDTRRPVILRGFRLTEDEAFLVLRNNDVGLAGLGIQNLTVFTAWRGRVLVADAEIQAQVRSHAPGVIGIPVDSLLVAVVG